MVILKFDNKNFLFRLNYNIFKETQIGLGGQCGGIGYNGSTTCVSGLTCFIAHSGFSGCYQSCPVYYWRCQGNGKIKAYFILIIFFLNKIFLY